MAEQSETTDTSLNFEEALGGLLKNSVSGSGEEELLRIASRYSLQITANQIKALLFLEYLADMWKAYDFLWEAEFLYKFCAKWLQLKENNNSDMFVMKALEYISLRRFLNEQSFKVNIQK
jgi:hypothetical protein